MKMIIGENTNNREKIPHEVSGKKNTETIGEVTVSIVLVFFEAAPLLSKPDRNAVKGGTEVQRIGACIFPNFFEDETGRTKY
jgi:hypothetical protein